MPTDTLGGLAARALQVARAINPATSTPARPLETVAWLDSFDPSLMPRVSAMQGVVGGLGLLSARALSWGVERATDAAAPPTAAPRRRLGVRLALMATGMAVERLPEVPRESMWVSGTRTGGRLLWVTSMGGALHDVATGLADDHPPSGAVRPVVTTAAALAGLATWASRRLGERNRSVEPWPVEQRNALPQSFAATLGVATLGLGLGRGFVASRRALTAYFGPGPVREAVGRTLNLAAWTGAAVGGYTAGVAWIGRANEKLEPAYARPPTSPRVSGSPASLSPFEDLGQQGRRFVTDVVTPELVRDVMGEEAVAEPIRVFVGFDSEPVYATGRAEMALEELERTGAYDRGWLLLVAPTGTGWVDHTMIEATELLTRGDVATVCIQYGRFPSFLSVQKVALGRAQFRLLLLGMRERLRERPPERRPRVLVFGESLGAWASSDVVMYQGIQGFDHYGVDRALWVGLPGLAKWSRNGMARGRSDLVPPGTVGVFDHPDQLMDRSPEERARLRATILSHDNDPIARLSPDLLVRRPEWLDGARGRGVPDAMPWRPLVTFWQVAVDAANAMVTRPGEFRSYGHDYRADMARMVLYGYGLPATTTTQLDRVERALRDLEVDRAQRIAASSAEEAPPPPRDRAEAPALVASAVPLRPRTSGARWRRTPARR
jgi:uncharacterized membrane protein